MDPEEFHAHSVCFTEKKGEIASKQVTLQTRGPPLSSPEIKSVSRSRVTIA